MGFLHHSFALIAAGFAVWFPQAVLAALVGVEERSDPAGIVSRSTVVETSSEHLTLAAPMESAGYRFTHWTINGGRQNDSAGRAMNPARFTVYEAIDAVANYLPTAQDSDGDGVPDWFEVQFFGDLSQGAGDDADGDGLTLDEECRHDKNPNLRDTGSAGGVSMRNGGLTTVLINPNFSVYAERSEPPGLVERSMVVSNGTQVTSLNLGEVNQGYAFAYWEVGGERKADGFGMSLSSFTMTVTNHTVAVARYIPVAFDSVGDGIPDWWRMRCFGNLDASAGSDGDGDGVTLAEEYRYDGNPLLGNTCLSGGVSMRNSELTLVNLAGFYQWSIASVPAGLVEARSGVAQTGTVIVTASLGEPVSGYRFGYWSLNGVRQADPSGVALSRLSFAVAAHSSVLAHFFPVDADADANGLPDWWEYRHFGATGQDADRVIGSDGLTLGEAWRYDYSPAASNTLLSGGVSARNSEWVTVNLQPFERVQHVLVEGVLSAWYTVWPTGQLGVAAFGGATVSALGDWDGDGDADLFVTSSNGAFRVFENAGSRYTPDLAERSGAAGGLAPLLGGMHEPHLALGDWSGDGRDDAVVGADGGKVMVIASTGHFTVPQLPAVAYGLDLGVEAGRILPAIAEVTGDGKPDLLVLQGNGLVGVLAHSGDVGQPYGLPLWTNDLLGVQVPAATGLSAADISRDGRKDLLIADGTGRVWEFWSQPDGRYVLKSKVWAGTGPGFAEKLTLSAADLDGDGDSDALAGFGQGGLMFLRDPRLGPPTDVRAVGGAGSVALTWEPDRQSRVKGYAVYRASSREGPFLRLNEGLISQPYYNDVNVQSGQTLYYYVTAATLAYYPGSSVGVPRESPPSDVVEARAGSVRLWMPDYAGRPGMAAVLKINVDRAEGITGAGLLIGIRYDPALLTPIGQVYAQTQTVRRTALSDGVSISDNALTATGELFITGSSGNAVGAGCLFDVVFQVSAAASSGSVCTNTFTIVSLKGADGCALTVDAADTAVFSVTAVYGLGDINGDGVLDMNDHAFLMWLLKKDARIPTPQELSAGDIDGDGRLTQRDIPLMLRLIHGKSVNP